MKRKKVSGTELILVLLVSVILSNGSIINQFSPFAVALSSALAGIDIAVSLIGALVGFIAFGKFTASLSYIAVILFLCAYELLAWSFKWKLSILKKSILTSLTLLICDVFIAPWQGFEISRITMIIFNATICGLLSYTANFLLTNRQAKNWLRPNTKQLLFLGVAFTSIICALSSFEIWLLNAGIIAGMIVVLVLSRRSVSEVAVCGALTTAGVAIGNLPFANSCLFLAVGGIISAVLYKYGKLQSTLGFISVCLAGVLVTGIDVYTVGLLLDMLIAAAVSAVIKYSPDMLTTSNISSSEYAAGKLMSAAEAVNEVKDNINKVADMLDKKTAKNTAWIYEKASGVVCRTCDRNMICWQENYDRTAKAMALAVGQYDSKTSITTADLPEYLRTSCKRNAEFTDELNGFYSSYLADLRATRKLISQRKLIINQLDLAREMFVKVSDDLNTYSSPEAKTLATEVKVISQPASGRVSGDASNAFCDDDGNFYFCLFDGMGKGKRAAVDSNFLSNIIGELAGTGVDMDTVMKTANDCMMVKSGDESFSTADIIKINLKNGKTEIIKAGSAPTYFISNGVVTKIATKTFPLGVFTGTKSEKTVITAQEGDIFVLASDGAGDITALLECSKTTNTEMLAENLLDFAKKNNEEYKDDVSIAVIKLKKC